MRKIERMKGWSKIGMLKKIRHRGGEGMEIKIETDELTFEGVKEQADFGRLILYFYPDKWDIELKSFKKYLFQFRSKIVSYERLTDVIYYDLMYVYKPCRIRIIIKMKPRGGIVSVTKADSDWKTRGGREEYKDWVEQSE